MMDIETDTHYFYSKGTKTHNSDFFDMPYIAKRIEKTLGKSQLRRLSFEGADMPRYREVEVFKQQQIACDLSGRVHLDYMNLFKKYEVAERPSYKLESIAEEVLPHLPKLEYEGSLADLYKKDFNHFIKYNIRDTEILKGFEKKLGYISLANVMCHSSTSQFKDVFGTLKLSDFAVVNYCHYELDVKVPDWDGDKPDGKIQGAYVLLPQIGLHEWIGSIDIGGLYPASIRSINISPETLIGQFSDKVNDWERIFNNTDDDLTLEYDTGEVETRTAVEWKKYLLNKKWAVSGFGTVFDQNTPGVFPAILSSWINKRKEYQKLKAKYYADAEACTDPDEKSKLEELCAYYDRLQYVMKIKSNSFYGAITNFYFRFFSLNGGESVTGTGRIVLKHQIKKTAEILDGEYNIEPPFDEDSFNKMGRTFPSESIIYSDTDSVVGSTVHITNQGDQTIETLFNMYSSDNCNNFTCKPQNLEVLTYDPINQNPYMGEVEYIYRHLVSKEKWLIQSEHGDSVEITGDHSVMVEREGKLIEVKPENIICGDLLITCVEV
jgi:DNA polymerase elongation subunit (family B)